MGKTINETRIAGHITEPKRFGSGPVRISINTGGWQKKNGDKAPDCWHRIAIWPNQCPEVDTLRKGQYLIIYGRINYPTFNPNGSQTLENWVKYGNFCEIIADRLEFEEQESPMEKPAFTGNHVGNEIDDSDLPF